MKICFATYQAVMMLKGGPRTQILQTKAELEKLGVKVALFDGWKEFRKADFDLVHIFSANIGTYHLARMFKMLGVPTVVTPIFYTRRYQAAARSVVRFDHAIRTFVRGFWTDYGLIAEMSHWAKGVFPNTMEEASLLANGFGVPQEKISVIPNGVEQRFSNADAGLFRKKVGIERFILNVGHIGPERKNVHRLIQALDGINHQAVIIGRIEETARGKACLELARKNARITIIDSLPHDSPLLASAYAACDAFVLPSLFETPGIAALEAGLAGAKVVITPHGGTKEYFGNDAQYVDPYSVDDIRRGILASLEKRKSATLRDRIMKEFLWKGAAKKTKGEYEKLLTSH